MIPRQPVRVLLVEDHPLARDAMARWLRSRRCDVTTACHGAEGLDRLATADFDVVVSDIEMPVMDGLTFLKRALERDPSLRHRFILCSAAPQPLADPGIHFLLKPLRAESFAAVLARVLEQSAAASRER